MKFSIIHPTARVMAEFEHAWWQAAYSAFNACDNPRDVEYIIVVHHSRIVQFHRLEDASLPRFGKVSVVINYGRDCIVDQCNAGQLAASGEIVVGNQDDLRFPEHWDTEISKLLPDTSRLACVRASNDNVRTDLLTIPTIATKALLDAIGPLYPEYTSMCSDDEWSYHARTLGIVIPAAHLHFEHLHPTNGKSRTDAVYEMENSGEAYRVGTEVFLRRKAQGFPRPSVPGFPDASVPCRAASVQRPLPPRPGIVGKAMDWLEARMVPPSAPPSIAVARRHVAFLTPGESHHATWEAMYVNALGTLGANGWVVHPAFHLCTNVYGTRIKMTDFLISKAESELKPQGIELEYVIWEDDDNPADGAQVLGMLQTLDAHPELDGLVGWCFIRIPDPANPERQATFISCGQFGENGIDMRPITWEELHGEGHGDATLKPIECSGFPLFAVRYSAVKKLGREAFYPIFHPSCAIGFSGEDLAWFRRAKDAGLKFAVDPRLKVPHLKFHAQEPDFVVRAESSASRDELAAFLEARNGRPLTVSQKSYEFAEGTKV